MKVTKKEQAVEYTLVLTGSELELLQGACYDAFMRTEEDSPEEKFFSDIADAG